MFVATSCGKKRKKKIACHFKVPSAVAAFIFSQVNLTGVEVYGSSIRKTCICLSQKNAYVILPIKCLSNENKTTKCLRSSNSW